MVASAAMVTSASLVSSPPPRGRQFVLPVSVRLSPKVGGGAGVSRISNCNGFQPDSRHFAPQAMAQVGGILLQFKIGHRNIFFLGGVDNVKFHRPVVTGDTLIMRMNLIKLQKRFGIAKMEEKAYVGGEVVCEREFPMAFGRE